MPANETGEMEAACHCSTVRFRVKLSDGFNTARRCTCSYCRMRRGTFYMAAFESAAGTLKVDPITVPVRNISEIEPAIAMLAQTPDTGLIVSPDSFTQAHDKLVVTLASKYRMPAIYGNRSFPGVGGLMSYGPNFIDTFRRSASYIDCILRGERPANLI